MSDTPVDPTRDLVEDYALGMLGAAERTAFEERLRTDAALRQEVAATLETLADLALSTPATLRPELKNRVMERIDATGMPSGGAKVLPLVSRAPAPRLSLWLGAALAASLLLVAKLSFSLQDVRQDATAAQAAVAANRVTLAQRDSVIAQLTDPTAETVTLAATGTAKPVLKAYVNRARRTMMLSAGLLDSLPAGRVYQVWFIVDGKPVPSVTFRPDSMGRALLRELPMPSGAVAATAITDEPAGGSAAPTTKPLFVGKLATE
jgi:anti-sigma-K factor RskA